jgi:transforming growth factor-beta-induced protein
MHTRITRALGSITTLSILAIASSSSSGSSSGDGSAALKDIIGTAADAGKFKILAELLTDAGLVGALQGTDLFTVFAPTDEAFGKLPKPALDAIKADKKLLTKILTYHVVPGKVLEADVVKAKAAASLEGENVSIDVVGSTVTLNKGVGMLGSAKVTSTNVLASNGVIHIIDSVLVPPTYFADKNIVQIAQGNADFSKLVDAVVKAKLVDALSADGTLTVFAPTNAAFTAIQATVDGLTEDQLANVLKYHVVPKLMGSEAVKGSKEIDTLLGKKFTVKLENGAVVLDNKVKITSTDIAAKNGIIHVLDAVLVPAP